MSEDTKKVEETAAEPKATELSEKDLEQVAGGGASTLGAAHKVVQVIDKSSF